MYKFQFYYFVSIYLVVFEVFLNEFKNSLAKMFRKKISIFLQVWK